MDCMHGGATGNISAHAEKTSVPLNTLQGAWKHLCACREDGDTSSFLTVIRETSLRMQRRLSFSSICSSYKRNISAHAEKTNEEEDDPGRKWKHLCACREDSYQGKECSASPDTSLSMQRRHAHNQRPHEGPGNISAHAEKTSHE